MDVAEVINNCEYLAYYMPWGDVQRLQEIANGFCEKSNRGIMKRCVGALDGFLLLIDSPRESAVANYKDYFSGHYHAYGVNVQALVDSKARFMEVALAAPGASSDITAVGFSKIDQKIETLPQAMFVAADNAYTCSEHLLIPFSGADKFVPRFDAYNFHLSQVRIKVEQAFGRLTNKFRILRRSLSVKYENIRPLFLAMTRIHNYCINMNTPDDAELHDVMVTIRGQQMTFVPSDIAILRANGNSFLREHLVETIATLILNRLIISSFFALLPGVRPN
jgi:hypothetical protein